MSDKSERVPDWYLSPISLTAKELSVLNLNVIFNITTCCNLLILTEVDICFFSIEATRMDSLHNRLKRNFNVFRFILISQSTTGSFIVSLSELSSQPSMVSMQPLTQSMVTKDVHEFIQILYLLCGCRTLKWPILLCVR